MTSSGLSPSTVVGGNSVSNLPENQEADTSRVESMTRLREQTAEFLRRVGVPAFAGSIVWKYGRIMPLIWMLSFQLGVVTASEVISGNALIVSAPIVAFVAFLAGPMSANALAIDTSRHRWWLIPLAVVPIFVFFLIRDTIIVAAAAARYLGAKRRDRTRSCEATASRAKSVERQIAEPRLRYWIPTFLLAYPALALVVLR